MQDYNKAINLNPDSAEAYNNRGNAYAEKGEFDGAIRDHNKAIEVNPEYAEAYYNRGMIWLCQAEAKKAKDDLMTAKNKGVDIAAAFHNNCESIAAFEANHDVQVPEDIAALLSRD